MTNTPGTPKSWKGNEAEAVFEPARHRWQAGDASLERSVIKAQERSVRLRLAILAGIAVGMLAAFIAILLWGPTKTPLISVAATNYAWPLPPNAWAYEDVHGLSALHDKNIDWRDASSAWQSNRQARSDLRLQLDAALPLARRSGALVIYLSMHGAVDNNQQPCLLPSGSSPLLPEQWIKLGDIVAMVPKSDAEFHTLLVLDCVDEQVNWQAGVVQSTFAERVIDWVKEHELGNCSILLSAAPQQSSLSGPELQSSIFGRELQLGLCGAADSPSRNVQDEAMIKSPYPNVRGVSLAGNGDGIVSLYELTNYLQHRLRKWARTHRQQEQTPLLLSKHDRDQSLVRTLSGGELSRLEAASNTNQLAVAKPSLDEMAPLWRMLDTLRQRESYRYEPRAWANLEHQLLWLEKLSTAGRAYADQASLTLYPDLKKRLQQSLELAAQVDTKESLVARSKILTNVPVWRLDEAALPSLAWMDLVTDKPPCDTSVMRAGLLATLDASANKNVEALMSDNGLPSNQPVPNELNFVALLHKSGCAQLWPDQSVLRQVLELRDQCERLAVLGDVRGHRLRRQSLAQVDAVRRQLEDQLFIGAKIGDDRLPEQLRQAGSLVDSATETKRSIERSLAIRDRGLAEVPYLTAWICAPGNDMSNLGDWLAKDGANPLMAPGVPQSIVQDKIDPQLRERIARQRLERLIENLKTLSVMIQSAQVSGDADVKALITLGDETARDLDAMQYLVRDHVQRSLHTVPAQTTNVGQIRELLQLPFIAANDRLELYKQLEKHLLYQPAQGTDPTTSVTDALIARVQKEITSQPGTEEADAATPALQTNMGRYSFRMQQWPVHPLARLLSLKSDTFSLGMPASNADSKVETPTESLPVDALNDRLRNHFLGLAAFNARQLTTWARDTGLDVDSRLLEDEWSRTALAANIERMHVAVCPVHPEHDTVAEFLSLALEDQVLWYAGRTLKDFYADGRGLPGAPASQAYFDQAVQRLIQIAQLLAGPEAKSDGQQEIVRRQEILRTFARSGLRATVKAGIPNPVSKQVTYEISLEPTLTLPPESSPEPSWPRGVAAAWLQNDSGMISNDRQAMALPTGESGSTAALAMDATNREVSNEALVWFRGHTYRAPLFVGQGIIVDYQPSRYDWAQVVLFGDRVQQPSIVFILDCSWSMGEPLAVESLGTDTQSRLDLAKSHVLKLIEELSLGQEARLGVRLFGHRLGWSRPVDPKTGLAKGSSQVIPQPNYPRSIPEDVVPSRDVEAIVPLGRFTPEMLGSLSKDLSTIVPWGQSPLYLSIIESFKDFSADNQTTTKSIVVITDGDNFQFNATRRPGGDGGAQTSMEDVLAAWQTAKIPLYILGVGVANQKDAAGTQSRANLKSLAERTGGKYYDIDSGGDLLRALAEQTSSATYKLRSLDARGSRIGSADAEEQEYQLNETADLKLGQSDAKYEIIFQSIAKDFSLQGGEALEMVVGDDGQSILSRPYDIQSPKSAMLSRTGESNLLARVHRPQPQDRGVLFPISFQYPQQHFTPRPTETWIEVSPVAADGQAMRKTYLFYDSNYDARTPVPRQTWLASDWPQNSTAAEVRIWARYDHAPISAAVKLSELTANAERWAAGTTVSGIPEVSLRMVGQAATGTSKAWMLHVTEIHSPKSRGIGSLRIGLDGGSVGLPQRVTRRFDVESRLAIHSFEFDMEAGQRLLNSGDARLTITTRENALDQAYQLQGGQPIRVEFVRSLDLLPLPTRNSDNN